MSKVLITGTSSGIGKATAELFLEKGFNVVGLDIASATITHPNFVHIDCDVSNVDSLPEIHDLEYLINNAGTIDEETAIAVNLEGYINVAEKYCYSNDNLKSVLFVGSISGQVGLDTPRYAASQGGRVSYMKNLAIRMGNEKKIPVNCVSFGAVLTGLEPNLYSHQELIDAVASENLLKKWIQPEEAAEWLYFVSVVNKSMTGEEFLIDNGEKANFNFIKSR